MAGLSKRRRTEHRFTHVGTLESPAGFDVLVTASVGPDGLPVALWASADADDDLAGRHEGPGGATFPNTRTSSRQRVALTRHGTTGLRAELTVIDAMPVAHPHIQPLPDGGYLVVGSRCAWHAGGPERNALWVGADGSILQTGTLGDGIAHMLVDHAGHIWIGYYDEGIFGNFGWGGAGPKPLGSAGIVEWSPGFEKLWEFHAADDYALADCYTLNVDLDRVWSCPYDDFPIVGVRDRIALVLPTNGVGGPWGLLVAGGRVAIIGDYNDRGSLLVGALDDLSGLRRSALAMPNGSKPPRGELVCRGSVASLFVGPEWFSFDLSETGPRRTKVDATV